MHILESAYDTLGITIRLLTSRLQHQSSLALERSLPSCVSSDTSRSLLLVLLAPLKDTLSADSKDPYPNHELSLTAADTDSRLDHSDVPA